jgi:hypothetical protein
MNRLPYLVGKIVAHRKDALTIGISLYVEICSWRTRPGINIRPYVVFFVQHEKRAQGRLTEK